GNFPIAKCTTGIACSTWVWNLRFGLLLSEATYFTAYVAPATSWSAWPPTNSSAVSNPVVVDWSAQGTDWPVALTATPPVTTPGSSVLLAARLAASVLYTGLSVSIEDELGNVLRTCSRGSSCQTTVTQ